MNRETYEKIHQSQMEHLRNECERMVAEGTIVSERFNVEWIEDCDAYIASRCRELAENGVAQVLEDAVNQMAADYFNDELHEKWEEMEFEPLSEKKTPQMEKKDTEIDVEAIKKQAVEDYKKNEAKRKKTQKLTSKPSKSKPLRITKRMKQNEKKAELEKKKAEKEAFKNFEKRCADEQIDLFAMTGV